MMKVKVSSDDDLDLSHPVNMELVVAGAIAANGFEIRPVMVSVALLWFAPLIVLMQRHLQQQPQQIH
jgi:hypothetical protein